MVVLAIIAIMATAAYGFAASNTIADAGHAGDGSGAVSGYSITNMQWTLDKTDPSSLDSVAFSTDAAAGVVKASLDNGANWYGCTSGDTKSWTCDFTGGTLPTVKSVNNLRVAATN